MAEELVTLWRYRDLPEALVARAKLDSDGVWCVLADDNMVRLNWYVSNTIGGMRLKVSSDDAEHAMALLGEEIPAGFTADETGEAYQHPECPKCHSRDVTFEPPRSGVILLLLWLLPVLALLYVLVLLLLPRRKNPWQCEDCGHQWNVDYD
jgi:hypothetical protein